MAILGGIGKAIGSTTKTLGNLLLSGVSATMSELDRNHGPSGSSGGSLFNYKTKDNKFKDSSKDVLKDTSRIEEVDIPKGPELDRRPVAPIKVNKDDLFGSMQAIANDLAKNINIVNKNVTKSHDYLEKQIRKQNERLNKVSRKIVNIENKQKNILQEFDKFKVDVASSLFSENNKSNINGTPQPTNIVPTVKQPEADAVLNTMTGVLAGASSGVFLKFAKTLLLNPYIRAAVGVSTGVVALHEAGAQRKKDLGLENFDYNRRDNVPQNEIERRQRENRQQKRNQWKSDLKDSRGSDYQKAQQENEDYVERLKENPVPQRSKFDWWNPFAAPSNQQKIEKPKSSDMPTDPMLDAGDNDKKPKKYNAEQEYKNKLRDFERSLDKSNKGMLTPSSGSSGGFISGSSSGSGGSPTLTRPSSPVIPIDPMLSPGIGGGATPSSEIGLSRPGGGQTFRPGISTGGYRPGPVGNLPEASGKFANAGKGMNAENLVKSGVNPLLVESLQQGAIRAFGNPDDPNTRYVLKIEGGMRNDSASKHGQGMAVDNQIFDRKTGKVIGADLTGSSDIMKNAFGNPHTYRMYEALNQGRYQYLLETKGKEVADKMSWGGRFSKSRQGAGPDSMHSSWGEGQALGKITDAAQGWVPEWLKKHGAAASEGMGKDPLKWSSPFINEKIDKGAAPSPETNPTIDNRTAASPTIPVSTDKKSEVTGQTENKGGGAAWLSKQREKYFAELDTNPELRKMVSATIMHETNNTEGATGVLEAMVNRASRKGYTSLKTAIYDGFYGPVNRREVNPNSLNKGAQDTADYAIDKVRKGSNIAGFRDDQGTGRSGQPEVNYNGPGQSIVKIGGEHHYFQDKSSITWAEKQQKLYNEAEKNKVQEPPKSAALAAIPTNEQIAANMQQRLPWSLGQGKGSNLALQFGQKQMVPGLSDANAKFSTDKSPVMPAVQPLDDASQSGPSVGKTVYDYISKKTSDTISGDSDEARVARQDRNARDEALQRTAEVDLSEPVLKKTDPTDAPFEKITPKSPEEIKGAFEKKEAKPIEHVGEDDPRPKGHRGPSAGEEHSRETKTISREHRSHHPEQSDPTPGNHGYGQQKDPDGVGLCSI